MVTLTITTIRTRHKMLVLYDFTALSIELKLSWQGVRARQGHLKKAVINTIELEVLSTLIVPDCRYRRDRSVNHRLRRPTQWLSHTR